MKACSGAICTDKEDAKNPPRWTIDSVGIEEFVTHDVIMPPGGSAVFAVEDATGLVTADTGKFVARQIPLQDQLISNGTGLAYCPNAPEYRRRCYGGRASHRDPAKLIRASPRMAERPGRGLPDCRPTRPTGASLCAAGSIAISRRGRWGTGSDHLVWLPDGDGPTFYSHDGGKSWKPSEGFPLKSGYWIFALKQRALAADPFTPDAFYFVASWAGGFYVSTDGGKSWHIEQQAGLPTFNHHGQLAVNRALKNDLWFCDGWDGASQHGLWHSTTGGKSFTKLDGIEFAITLCLGAGSGKSGDAKFSVYFYGKLAESPEWGIFRSTNAGKSLAARLVLSCRHIRPAHMHGRLVGPFRGSHRRFQRQQLCRRHKRSITWAGRSCAPEAWRVSGSTHGAFSRWYFFITSRRGP